MLPLGLSMLWEAVEPTTALRDRFGFDTYEAAAEWVSTLLGREWGVRVSACRRLVISDQNVIGWVSSDLGALVVKWSRAHELFARLDASTRLLRRLTVHGLPVASPVPTVNGLDRVVVGGPSGPLSVSVLPELSGAWLDVADARAVHSAGACLAKVHQALGASGDDVLLASARAPRLADRISDWIVDDDRGWAPSASRRLEQLLSGLPALADHAQLVHNDFRAANILVRDATVTGVLDFDDVVLGYRVNDLAKASVYLGTRFTDWQPTSAAVRHDLRAGYESVRPLGSDESRWLAVLVLWQGIQAIPSGHQRDPWVAAC